MNIEETIARVLELDEKATQGPWASFPDAILLKRDCQLISQYRTAAPELARECRRLKALVPERCQMDGCENLAVWIFCRDHIFIPPEKRKEMELVELRKRIIDAACLRDDVSDDEMVDAVRRLAEPSSGKAWNPVGTDPPPPGLRGRGEP